MTVFRIGTRGSPLALAQAHMVAADLRAAHGWNADAIEIVTIRTTGDRVQNIALAEIGGKALWTKELDRALLDGETDCSVHSMKDVETVRPDELRIAAMLKRANTSDRLIGADSVAALPRGAVIGTSSPRRRAQLLRERPDLAIVLLRGNVDTRIAKVSSGEVHATLLAAAGLDRLGRDGVGVALADMLPAPAQGAVGIEVRAADARAVELVAAIDHRDTHECVLAERSLLAGLAADCHSPVAALATIADGVLTLHGELLSEEGDAHVTGSASGEHAGQMLAQDLLARAPEAVRKLFGG